MVETLQKLLSLNTSAITVLSVAVLCDIVTGLVKATLNHELKSSKFWGVTDETMTFNAVVGNPPYQGKSSAQLYPLFYLLSTELGNNVSLILSVVGRVSSPSIVLSGRLRAVPAIILIFSSRNLR